LTTLDTTIVVVPRERFSTSEVALETLLANTPTGVPVIYVDAGSPPRIASYLRGAAAARGIRLVRQDGHLSPNQARNLAIPLVETTYVVFIDNDALVEPGWLDAMVACAEETGAWAVGPLYFEGDPVDRIIHVAGGRMDIVEREGRREIETEHVHQGTRLSSVAGELHRSRTDFVEFHCMLVRRAVLDKLGPLDPELYSTREHLDLCLSIEAAGGEVWFEPSALVTYSTPPPLAWYDVSFFLRRWSDAWTRASLDRFYDKWDLHKDLDKRMKIVRNRRANTFYVVAGALEKLGGPKASKVFTGVVSRVEPPVNRALFRLPRQPATSA
jgi:GT2 family glycosyltransferase